MYDLFIEFYVRAFAVILPAIVIMIFAVNGRLAGIGQAEMPRLILPLIVLIGVWYGLASAMAEADLLIPPSTITDPPYVLMFLFGGAFFLWAYGRFTAQGRATIEATSQAVLIGFQIPRMMGGVFLVGWAAGVIPWEFALPAGVGDVWAGVAALQANRAVRRGDHDADRKVLRANIIGLLDFVVAITTGLITSEGFIHLLSKDAPNIVNNYPLALFPAFFVPIFFAFHLFSLGKLRQSHRMALA